MFFLALRPEGLLQAGGLDHSNSRTRTRGAAQCFWKPLSCRRTPTACTSSLHPTWSLLWLWYGTPPTPTHTITTPTRPLWCRRALWHTFHTGGRGSLPPSLLPAAASCVCVRAPEHMPACQTCDQQAGIASILTENPSQRKGGVVGGAEENHVDVKAANRAAQYGCWRRSPAAGPERSVWACRAAFSPVGIHVNLKLQLESHRGFHPNKKIGSEPQTLLHPAN